VIGQGEVIYLGPEPLNGQLEVGRHDRLYANRR
jgi:hypothetical protein